MLKKYFYTGYLKNGTVKFGIEKGNSEKEIRNLLKSRDIFFKKYNKNLTDFRKTKIFSYYKFFYRMQNICKKWIFFF